LFSLLLLQYCCATVGNANGVVVAAAIATAFSAVCTAVTSTMVAAFYPL
jgi:hypothetical protein